MIEKASGKILSYLIKSEVISDDKYSQEYFQYGIEILISSVLNVLIILTIGFAMNSIVESILFLICFIPLRQFTGGFHAQTYFSCNFIFGSIYFALISIYKKTSTLVTLHSGILMIIFTFGVIVAFCPVENENKPIPLQNKIKHKIAAVFICGVYGGIGVKYIQYKISIILLYTLILVSFLVVVAAIQNYRKKVKK